MRSSSILRKGLLLVLLLGGAWFAKTQIPDTTWEKVSGWIQNKPKQPTVKDYKFVPAALRDIRQTVLATGTVTLKTGAEVKIGARISGQLKKLFVKIGDFIRAGTVIAKIEDEDWMARVAQRTAEVETEKAMLAKTKAEGPLEINKSLAEIEELQAQLRLVEKTLERNQKLFEDGVVAKSVLDETIEDQSVLKAKIKVAQEEVKLRQARLAHDIRLGEARVAGADANLQETQTQLSFATITATIDGVVAFISTQEGETVVAGMSAPTFVTLIDLRKLEVTVFVDETDIGRIQVGQSTVFSVDSYPRKLFKGKVREIRPKAVIKDNVVNYEVILDIDRKDIQQLRPEMTANVVVTTGVRKQVVAIPKEALKRKGKETFVMVERNGQMEEMPVETGWRDEGWIQIETGVQEGQSVGILAKKGKPTDGKKRRR